MSNTIFFTYYVQCQPGVTLLTALLLFLPLMSQYLSNTCETKLILCLSAVPTCTWAFLLRKAKIFLFGFEERKWHKELVEEILFCFTAKPWSMQVDNPVIFHVIASSVHGMLRLENGTYNTRVTTLSSVIVPVECLECVCNTRKCG